MTTRTLLTGTPVVPGIGYGPVVRPAPLPVLPAECGILPESARIDEAARFHSAATTVSDRIRQRAAHASGAAAEVLTATAGLVVDRGWNRDAMKRIDAGTPATHAVDQAIETFAVKFERIGGLMAERITDLRDIRNRMVAELQGLPEPGIPQPATPSVLFADDLAPADTAGLDPRSIVALVTEFGGPTSHTAIIARQLGIPCVVAAAGLGAIEAGTTVLVNGESGVIDIEPDVELATRAVTEDRIARDLASSWSGPGSTRDGYRVAIVANVQDGETAQAAGRGVAEGVGLFRTELAFLDRDTEPTVAEQAELYTEVLRAFPGKKVVIRTLDAGSDKPLKFVPNPVEANPALGVRGIRIARDFPALLDRQLDAIAEAGARTGTTPWVMAPMIATVEEARDFARKVRERGMVPGVMIEVPAAALLAGQILHHVDFLSIGTNDLTQYTMAADRMSAPLADLTDPWQPALLALVSIAARAGAGLGKPVGVCGEAAADARLACVLVGLGVTSLSAAPNALPRVGAQLATVTLAQCQNAAAAALAASSPADARAAAAAALDR
ncbi:MAG: phosphoenolpyruvate--protein phosphotransferase [Nocardiaceae bacterium]|nr:phosphoenolpyruvate--protein phosphotransferase [Nocardiaceae bacterium]